MPKESLETIGGPAIIHKISTAETRCIRGAPATVTCDPLPLANQGWSRKNCPTNASIAVRTLRTVSFLLP